MPLPIEGARVHFVHPSPRECRDAFITRVHPSAGAGTLADLRGPEEVDVAVVAPDGPILELTCRHSEGARTGRTWHWAETC